MNISEELNRINLANNLMNQDHAELGIRPFQSAELAAPFERPRPKVKIKKPSNLSLPKLNLKALIPGLSIVLLLCLGYSLFFFISNAQPQSKGGRLSEIKAKTIPKSARALVITSGSFKNLQTAERYKERLGNKLGVELKILKDGTHYTVQIGPSYSNKEDAIVVFDELSRYSVRALSLRLDRV